jgi:hypothetical protein
LPTALNWHVYRLDGAEPAVIKDAVSVAGEGPVEGFVLSLAAAWDPLSRGE